MRPWGAAASLLGCPPAFGLPPAHATGSRFLRNILQHSVVLCAASPRGANPVNKGPSAGPSGLQDRIPWLEFGFRFELLLKTKDRLGSFRNLILGSSRGTLPAAPSYIRVSGIGVGNPLRATRIVIFRFQRSRVREARPGGRARTRASAPLSGVSVAWRRRKCG